MTLLDLSPAAIQLGLKRAAASGVAARVRGVARDASDLSCFADGEFDLIYASAAVHHTLKYPMAFEELVRVLRPGGTLVLAETYGGNPVLNWARRQRARIQGEAEEQGEEIILGPDEIRLLEGQPGPPRRATILSRRRSPVRQSTLSPVPVAQRRRRVIDSRRPRFPFL